MLSTEVKFLLRLPAEHSIKLKSSSRKYIEFGALCALAVGILWWFGRQLDWGGVRLAVSQSNRYLLGLAVLVICLAYLFRAYRWGALLAPLGPTSLSHLFAATTVGFGAVFLMGRMGEVVRPAVLPMRDPRVRASSSFVTIMVERVYDMMAVVVLFAVNLLWFTPPTNVGAEFSRVRIAGIVLLVLSIAAVAGLTWFRRRSKSIIGSLEKRLDRLRFMPVRLRRALISILEQLAKSLRVLVDARELAITIAWTAMVWAGITLANWLVLRAFGLRFGISEAIFILGWSLVGSLVPTPGGAAGAFHAATAAGLIFLGVTRETAAAVSIVMHVVDFGPAVVFGFFYFVRGDINLTRLRSLMSPEAVEHAVDDEIIKPDVLLMKQQRETVTTSE
ncbi:MAG: flippase-like domain-containing protein [Pyrinomonadaceae bacterium]|nr:flippase-like domain-containing protein [Pyrinomonadaceae bacterium]